MAEAKKDDAEKLRYDLVPFDALAEIVKVLNFGATKYAPRNWEAGFDWSRIYAATLRHLTSWWQGEDRDPETGLSHLAHAGCCILFLLAFKIRGAGKDDRPNSKTYGPKEVVFNSWKGVDMKCACETCLTIKQKLRGCE